MATKGKSRDRLTQEWNSGAYSEYRKKIAKKLKTLRQGAEKNQVQIIEEVGIGGTTLSKYESQGKFPAFLLFLKKLRDLYEISIDELISEEPLKVINEPELPMDLVEVIVREMGTNSGFRNSIGDVAFEEPDIMLPLLVQTFQQQPEAWEHAKSEYNLLLRRRKRAKDRAS
jgi:transcriptional regulator with XRE-family HTH domain